MLIGCALTSCLLRLPPAARSLASARDEEKLIPAASVANCLVGSLLEVLEGEGETEAGGGNGAAT